MKPVAFVTYDLELFESSIRSQPFNDEIIISQILKPLERQVDWILKSNLAITIFIELNQAIYVNKYHPNISARIKDKLKQAHKKSLVSFGLHIHPNWDPRNNCRIEKNYVFFGEQTYAYTEGRENEVVHQWVNDFQLLFGVLPTSFRAGKYREISKDLLHALCANGINIFSTTIQASLVVADNYDVFNYLNVSMLDDVTTREIRNQHYYDLPVTARNSIPIAIDYMSEIDFDESLKFILEQKINCICLVSHQKDLAGARFEKHIKKLNILSKYGFEMKSLTIKALDNICVNAAKSEVKFDNESNLFLEGFLKSHYIDSSTEMPFPEWLKIMLIKLSKNLDNTGNKKIIVRRILVLTGRRNDFLSFEVKGEVVEFHVPFVVNNNSIDFKFLMRKILLSMPLVLRNLLINFRMTARKSWSADVSLKYYLQNLARKI